jgi:hypothetical protein
MRLGIFQARHPIIGPLTVNDQNPGMPNRRSLGDAADFHSPMDGEVLTVSFVPLVGFSQRVFCTKPDDRTSRETCDKRAGLLPNVEQRSFLVDFGSRNLRPRNRVILTRWPA